MPQATWKHISGDESELTDLSDDEDDELEEEVESPPPPPPVKVAPRQRQATSESVVRKSSRAATQQATAQSKARSNFPPPALQAPRTTTYQASALYEMIRNKQIDLNPEYQRDVVWNDAKQSSLINSLYHNFHIPQILFSSSRDEHGFEKLVCIDGKQRLTSLFRFFDGQIPFRPNSNSSEGSKPGNKKYWFMKAPGTKGRTELDSIHKNNLRNKQIACVEYRVQLGVSLGPADRLPAINGQWANTVRDLRNRINTTEGFEGYLEWGKARGKDFQALAQVAYLSVHGSTPRKAEPTPSRIETFLAGSEDDSTKLRKDVFSTMDIFCRIASTPAWNEPLTVDLTPSEFVLSAYLIFIYRTKLSDGQLSTAISLLRDQAATRESKGAKGAKGSTNAQFKTLLAFINKNVGLLWSNGKLYRSEEKDRRPAAEVPYYRGESPEDRFKYNTDTAKHEAAIRQTGDGSSQSRRASGTKRKRKDEDEDASNESDIVPLSATSKRSKVKKQEPTTPAPRSKLSTKSGANRAKTTVRKVSASSAPTTKAATSSTTKKPTSTATLKTSTSSGKLKQGDQVAKRSVRSFRDSDSRSSSTSLTPATYMLDAPAPLPTSVPSTPPPSLTSAPPLGYPSKPQLPTRRGTTPKPLSNYDPRAASPNMDSIGVDFEGKSFIPRSADSSFNPSFDQAQARSNPRNGGTASRSLHSPDVSQAGPSNTANFSGSSNVYANMKFKKAAPDDLLPPSLSSLKPRLERPRIQMQPNVQVLEKQDWETVLSPNLVQTPTPGGPSLATPTGSAAGAQSGQVLPSFSSLVGVPPQRRNSAMITPTDTPSPPIPHQQPPFVNRPAISAPSISLRLQDPRDSRIYKTQDPRRRLAHDADAAAHVAAEHIRRLQQ